MQRQKRKSLQIPEKRANLGEVFGPSGARSKRFFYIDKRKRARTPRVLALLRRKTT